MKAMLLVSLMAATLPAADPGVTLPGKDDKAKHIVFVSGDEEYRSEEVLPQLARILNKHHGFKCTVLFAQDAEGFVNPNKSNIPGLEALKTADLMVIFTRFRNLPDEQMEHIHNYIESKKPIIGLRTATHAFSGLKNPKYSKYNWNCKEAGWEGGFGKQILGETWVSHHGKHGSEGTRGRINPKETANAIFFGINDGEIFGSSDVYTAKAPEDATVLLYGEVTDSLKPDSKKVEGNKKYDTMMPIAWWRNKDGRKVFTTTMGSGYDLVSPGTRKMLVNATYALLEMPITTPPNVEIVGEYPGSPFGNKKDDYWKTQAKRPADYFK